MTDLDGLGRLAGLAAAVVPDDLDCDGCLAGLAEYTEAADAGRPTDGPLAPVAAHLANCACCREEYEALAAAARAVSAAD